MSHKTKAQRQKEAQERQAAREKLTAKEQLIRIKARPGFSRRETERLEKSK